MVVGGILARWDKFFLRMRADLLCYDDGAIRLRQGALAKCVGGDS